MYLTDSTSCPMRHCNKCDMYRKELQKYKETGFTPEEIMDRELLRCLLRKRFIMSFQVERRMLQLTDD